MDDLVLKLLQKTCDREKKRTFAMVLLAMATSQFQSQGLTFAVDSSFWETSQELNRLKELLSATLLTRVFFSIRSEN